MSCRCNRSHDVVANDRYDLLASRQAWSSTLLNLHETPVPEGRNPFRLPDDFARLGLPMSEAEERLTADLQQEKSNKVYAPYRYVRDAQSFGVGERDDVTPRARSGAGALPQFRTGSSGHFDCLVAPLLPALRHPLHYSDTERLRP